MVKNIFETKSIRFRPKSELAKNLKTLGTLSLVFTFLLPLAIYWVYDKKAKITYTLKTDEDYPSEVVKKRLLSGLKDPEEDSISVVKISSSNNINETNSQN